MPQPLQMIGIDELNDPVSFRYEVRTPFGLVLQYMTVDIKILISDGGHYPAIGEALWNASIATAITRSARLDTFWWVRWKAAPLALPAAPGLLSRGRQDGTSASKGHTVQVMLHTGHSDDLAPQLLQLPSTPIAWQTDTMLNERGWSNLMTWAQGVKMGLAADDLGGDLQQLIAYPRIIEPTTENLSGTLFRKVTHIKVLQFTDTCPDFAGGLWP